MNTTQWLTEHVAYVIFYVWAKYVPESVIFRSVNQIMLFMYTIILKIKITGYFLWLPLDISWRLNFATQSRRVACLCGWAAQGDTKNGSAARRGAEAVVPTEHPEQGRGGETEGEAEQTNDRDGVRNWGEEPID